MPTALVIGATGQDASYLIELLLAKGYLIYGTVRRSSSLNTGRIDHLYRDRHEKDCRLLLEFADLCDASSLSNLVQRIAPDEIYNLGAQSHVRVSFDQPIYTADTIAMGTLRLLEAARLLHETKPVRFYQASSSEMFGNQPAPQSELTPFEARSPYAAAKIMAHHSACLYREAYGMHVSCGILFNHESPRRGETFVTRKIAKAVARIASGKQKRIYLGNLEARRDWGWAPDYVDAMWRMLQQDKPGDYVVATGVSYSVQDFLEMAFAHAGLRDWREYVHFDPRYGRPAEVDHLRGDASKARSVLGWAPTVGLPGIVAAMVDAEMEPV